MIKYQKVSGVSLSEAATLPSVTQTPEGKAMGSAPGWSTFIDPDYASNAQLNVRNRARRSTVMDISVSGAESGDATPVQELADSLKYLVSEQDRRIAVMDFSEVNPEAWSVFCVFSHRERTGAPPGRIVEADVAPSSDVSLSIAYSSLSGDWLRVYDRRASDSDAEVRIGYDGGFGERSKPSLVMITFSTEQGLRIFDGGEMVEQNADDKRPLVAGLEPSVANRWFVTGHGEFGMTGLLNIDLGAPENTGHRRAIEKFLMGKYDIPEGPQ